MKKRLVPLLAASAAVAALAVAFLAMRPTTAGAADASSTSKIVMTGSADAHVVPDQLTFGLVAHAEDPDLSKALQQANDAMRTAMDTLRSKGVAAKDITSTGLDMQPDYSYDKNQQKLRGYQVDQRADVTVRDLAKAGELISAVVSGGGNAVRTEGITLSSSDPEAALASARREAVANATAKAKQYAEAAGRSLGSVVTISEPSTVQTPQPYLADSAIAAAGSAASVPISPGQQTMTVEVTITWSLG